MQGVILAAGKGSRLQHITLTRSKAMLPILGKPMVERVMLDMVANGVQDFILVVSPDDRYITHYFRRESDLKAEVLCLSAATVGHGECAGLRGAPHHRRLYTFGV
jgi:mannose-1-phosphate guanylyltransferase